jgi:hypothetical protein
MKRIAKAAVATVVAVGFAIGAAGIPAGAVSASHIHVTPAGDTGWD